MITDRLQKGNKQYTILKYLICSDGATKYDVVTNALHKVGSKRQLRGYYSFVMQDLVKSGVVERRPYGKSNKYHITEKGAKIFLEAFFSKKI